MAYGGLGSFELFGGTSGRKIVVPVAIILIILYFAIGGAALIVLLKNKALLYIAAGLFALYIFKKVL